MDFAVANQRIIKKYLTVASVPLSVVSRDKLYPIVNNQQGADIGTKFVNGLKNFGLGTASRHSKHFIRFDPNDENCPDRENLKNKYKMLNI